MIVRPSTQFKKDLKRYQHQSDKLSALSNVLRYLKRDGKIPSAYKPHKLSGNFKGHWECHIEDNFLLIWIDETTNTIKLVRLGTHHELFGL